MARATALCLLLCACAQFPQIDARVPASDQVGPPPPLLPLGPILAMADAPGATDPAAELVERQARLAARAAALRGPVLSAEHARRLAEGPDTGALN